MESRRQRRLKSRQNRKSIAKRLSKLLKAPKKAVVLLVIAGALLTSSVALTEPESAVAHSAPEAQRALNTAYSYYGMPYIFNAYWKGLSAYGLDCSELTMYAYRSVGIELPDDPALQMQYGDWTSNPRPGDLLFFDASWWVPGVDHVGLATGRGTVLHASSYYGDVTETELRWMPGYVGAKRL